MSVETTHPLARLSSADGRILIEVPRSHGDKLQQHLRERGIASTVIFQSWYAPVRLEVWPGADEAAVRQAVAEYQAG